MVDFMIGGSQLGNSIETAEIAAGAVTAAKLASDAVETAKIKDANVTAAKLSTALTAQVNGRSQLVFNPRCNAGEGAAWQTTIDSNQADGWYYNNTPAAQNDYLDFECYLESGNYTVYVIGLTGADYGKIKVQLDGTDKGSEMDWYSAGNVYNVEKNSGAFDVATSAKYTLKLLVHDANASSSDYLFRPSLIWLVKNS